MAANLIDIGSFSLRGKGAADVRKVRVFAGEGERKGERWVWDGTCWRPYDEFESSAQVDRCVAACALFNGGL